jgi:hypothetical protein
MRARIAHQIAVARARAEYVPAPQPMSGCERHYTPNEVAQMWSVTPGTVRKIFGERVGVLKLGAATNKRYTLLRIPQSVLDQAHAEMTR